MTRDKRGNPVDHPIIEDGVVSRLVPRVPVMLGALMLKPGEMSQFLWGCIFATPKGKPASDDAFKFKDLPGSFTFTFDPHDNGVMLLSFISHAEDEDWASKLSWPEYVEFVTSGETEVAMDFIRDRARKNRPVAGGVN